jgi:AcrR family transcriptional regulator
VTRKPSTAPERREAVEQRVVDAVERLLHQGHSFAELSVGTIAEEAGVARSTFYVHFADKTQLLIRLAEAVTADIVAEGARWLTIDHGAGVAPLTSSLELIIHTYRRHEGLFEAILAGTGYDPAVAAFWRAHIEVIVTSGNERLRTAQADGLVNPDIDIEPLSRMVAWSIERTISMHVVDHPPAEDAALAAAMARALTLMMYGDAPDRTRRSRRSS